MSLQIEELKDAEQPSSCIVNLITSPGRWSVLRVKEEVHSQETKETIVMEAVLEDVGEGHSFRGEAMNKGCLELTLHIVQNDHKDAQLLVKSQIWVASIDLFT